MLRNECRSIQGAVRSIVAALVVCCALPEYSEAMPSTDDGFNTGVELSLTIPPEQSLSTSFLLSEWYQETGSGGFPADFSDEFRILDEWERSPDEGSTGSWSPYAEICVQWSC